MVHRARCSVTDTAAACDRMSSCHWVPGDDADCEWDGGEQEAGCCFISDFQNPNPATWTEMCKEYWFEGDCVRPMDANSNPRCQWKSTEEDADCSAFWPTPTPTDAPEPGCCAGD